ncbi:hypothetical protein PO81_10505, partial [Vibrio parahaemolyticus]
SQALDTISLYFLSTANLVSSKDFSLNVTSTFTYETLKAGTPLVIISKRKKAKNAIENIKEVSVNFLNLAKIKIYLGWADYRKSDFLDPIFKYFNTEFKGFYKKDL